MTPENAYTALLDHSRQLIALGQISGLLDWDQEVMMPQKGAAGRAEQSAALESVTHIQRTDPRIGEWLEAAQSEPLDPVEAANIRLIRRSYERAVKVPAKLAAELARTTSIAQGVWAQARQASDFSQFAPQLRQIIELKREEAQCIAGEGQSNYDALLNDFEPGMTVAVLKPLLENMRPRLSALRAAIADSGVEHPVLNGRYSEDIQIALARKLAGVVGYDWQAGRLDKSVHPFSSGTQGDSRITTRVDKSEPLGCLYSTVHELGHALYEQNLPAAHVLTPAGQHVSMGVHESQSRLWENQIGRSRAFCQWFAPHFAEAFHEPDLADAEHLYRVVNRVEAGFIRTEADEVHYNLHVLLRFSLEEDLISGALEVDDLEGEWNARFARDFGLAVPDAAHGVLQDVHWSVGLFGYFPTYSLGNIYAAQLNEQLRKSVPDLDGQLAQGETGAVLDFMRSHIHEHGSILPAADLIQQACGEPVSAEPLLGYLETKYNDLMGLKL